MKKMEAVGGGLKTEFPQPWPVMPSLQTTEKSPPIMWLFLCSLTVTHPSQPQLTTFCKLAHSIQCHAICDGFWMWRHHQVWSFLGKGIKNCCPLGKSRPTPLWVLLHLFGSPRDEVSVLSEGSSLVGLVPGVPSFLQHKELLCSREAGAEAWVTNSF